MLTIKKLIIQTLSVHTAFDCKALRVKSEKYSTRELDFFFSMLLLKLLCWTKFELYYEIKTFCNKTKFFARYLSLAFNNKNSKR